MNIIEKLKQFNVEVTQDMEKAFSGEFLSEKEVEKKKAIMAQIAEGVSVKNGKLIGFNDLLEDAKKNDASAFVDKEQQNLEQNKAKFTTSMSNKGGKVGTMTKDEIMAIKDRGERRDAMLATRLCSECNRATNIVALRVYSCGQTGVEMRCSHLFSVANEIEPRTSWLYELVN